jgi:cytochrome b6-f complex iron-sulfur subunit
MERKDFIKKTFGLCGLALIPAGIIESCSKQTYAPATVNFTVDLTNSANAALNHVGGVIYSNGVIVIRAGNTAFYALSDVCTHQGCTVGYNSSSGQIVCPCHGGTYSPTTGAVLAGPPPSGLQVYTVTQKGNILTIT